MTPTFRARALRPAPVALFAALSLFVSFAACGSSSPSPGDNGGDDGGGPGVDGSRGDAATSKDGQAGDDGGGSQDGQGGQGDSGGPPPVWVTNPASHVNTLVGTTGGGNVFPGADYPFGMMQWSPDTSPDRSEGGGYEYADSQILGFSLTHISGPGCGAFGDIPILPMTGGLPTGDPTTHTEPFSHTGEVATAGYYAVQSGSPAITTELTATLHSAMARFTFPATTDANLLFKLLDSQNGASGATATIVGNSEVSGSAVSGHFCGAGDVYTVHFDVVFDQPFTASQVINASGKTTPGFVFLTFDTTKTAVVQAKIAISYVSAANARGNWTAENPSPTWDFDGVHASATAAWNSTLGQIQIAGGTSTEQDLFYTALYHSLLHPNVFSDTSGQYMGFDNQVHTLGSTQKDQYANYSSWDIYHSQVQLSALVAPQAMSDSAQSMLNDAAQNGGMLPKWSLANGESYVMVGDPADGIIAGYYAFGATAFDTATALEVMMNEATVPNDIRPGLEYYEKLGYLPDDGTYGCCNFYGSVATLLEYGQADFALAQFAAAQGDTADATMLLARAQSWQNVFNPAIDFFDPKLLDGTFVGGMGMTSSQGMVEGSASQYRWILGYDRGAQIAGMGGASVVNPMLDTFFANLDDFSGNGALISNEFELGAQYWSTYTGEPWKTQDIVNRLRTQVYAQAPKLIDNNDDLGALSSQLAWSMLGFFPDYPGSAILTINGPEFTDELFHLPGGATLTVHAAGASDATPYIQSMQVNGHASTRQWLDPSLVKSGGTVDFTMGATASTTWGSGASDIPPSYGMESTSALGFVAQQPVVVAPGASTALTFGAQSTRTDTAQTVTWTAAGTAGGVTVDTGSGSLSLAAGAKATAALNVKAPTAQGTYDLTIKLTSSTGNTPPTVVLPVIVATAGALFPYFNNAGISDDSNGSANFDGVGYSYSLQALAAGGATAGGTLTVGGVPYHWPSPAAGALDNIEVAGQVIAMAPNTGKKTLGLLGSATNAGSGGATGAVTVTFADKSTQAVPVVFSDWTLGGGGYQVVAGDTVAVTAAYRNAGGSKDAHACYVYAFTAPLTSTQSVSSVTLPASTSGGSIHVFDIELN